MPISGDVALIGGNPTKPGSSYHALIKAEFSLPGAGPGPMSLDLDPLLIPEYSPVQAAQLQGGLERRREPSCADRRRMRHCHRPGPYPEFTEPHTPRINIYATCRSGSVHHGQGLGVAVAGGPWGGWYMSPRALHAKIVPVLYM